MPLRPLMISTAVGVLVGVLARTSGYLVADTPADARVATLAFLAFLVPASIGRVPATTWVITSSVAGLAAGEGEIGFAVLTAAWAVLAVATAVALRRDVRRDGVVAAGVASLALFTWLTWPLWQPAAGGPVPAWRTAIHPVFAADAATPGGPWAEQPHIYARTAFGSDLAYVRPQSSYPAAAAHAAAAGVLIGVVTLRDASARRRRASRSAPKPQPG